MSICADTALTAATKITIRTEYYAPGRVTSVNGGASAAQCSSTLTTTRRAPLRPTRADWPRYCSRPGVNSCSCISGHESRGAIDRWSCSPFGTLGNVRRFRDMPIEFYFTPELHLKDERIIRDLEDAAIFARELSVIECFETDGGVNYRSDRLILF